MAARDAVELSGRGRYNVETGRRDGLESSSSVKDLPSPSFSVSQTIQTFEKKRLGPMDMVLLLGMFFLFRHVFFPLFKDRTLF
ncbi:hypothetical protein DITRI_Ditri14bG0040800 [Diplodiscus trichospermus]